jgi:hypothetical protein
MRGPLSHNLTGGLVQGYWYRVIALGSTFDFWMERKLSRMEARKVALEFIGSDIYADADIDSVVSFVPRT